MPESRSSGRPLQEIALGARLESRGPMVIYGLARGCDFFRKFRVVRLVSKSSCAKGRFLGFWFVLLTQDLDRSSGAWAAISALFFSCGCSSAPSSRLELVTQALGLLRKDFWQTV